MAVDCECEKSGRDSRFFRSSMQWPGSPEGRSVLWRNQRLNAKHADVVLSYVRIADVDYARRDGDMSYGEPEGRNNE